ncbi:tyrosine-type recombinase/integrase [Herbidospora daliensis]|uniref:tyrosine-type recombinase/integrase n=1 Tax=Herbidospora daliensis TaxID=295585 RepID=UPI000A036FB6|nr:tyrosine-type recombinase/integrase [Herbidospora daliensis]
MHRPSRRAVPRRGAQDRGVPYVGAYSRVARARPLGVREGRPQRRNASDGRQRAQVGLWKLERAIRKARSKVQDLPTGFRFHDLRHYLALLLIASGADVKVVQARLRHASAKTTLDTYGHLWPDSDESTRAAIDAVFTARAELRQNQHGTAR